MISSLSLLVLLLSEVWASPAGLSPRAVGDWLTDEKMADVFETYARTGQCFYFFEVNDMDMGPCEPWCKEKYDIDTYGVSKF